MAKLVYASYELCFAKVAHGPWFIKVANSSWFIKVAHDPASAKISSMRKPPLIASILPSALSFTALALVLKLWPHCKLTPWLSFA